MSSRHLQHPMPCGRLTGQANSRHLAIGRNTGRCQLQLEQQLSERSCAPAFVEATKTSCMQNLLLPLAGKSLAPELLCQGSRFTIVGVPIKICLLARRDLLLQ